MSTFNELVNQIDNYITNQRDRGTAFEKLAVAYLKMSLHLRINIVMFGC